MGHAHGTDGTHSRGVLFFLPHFSQGRVVSELRSPNTVIFGIVQKVFSEKASAIARMRQKCVRNTSEMRQNESSFIGKRGTSKMRQKSVKIASKMRRKCAEHLWGRTAFGRYRNLLAFLQATACRKEAPT